MQGTRTDREEGRLALLRRTLMAENTPMSRTERQRSTLGALAGMSMCGMLLASVLVNNLLLGRHTPPPASRAKETSMARGTRRPASASA